MPVETTTIKIKGTEGALHDFDAIGASLTEHEVGIRAAHAVFVVLGQFTVEHEGRVTELPTGAIYDMPSMATYRLSATALAPLAPAAASQWLKAANSYTPPEGDAAPGWVEPAPMPAPEMAARLVILRRTPTRS